jgi:hypothetical protein
VSNDKDKKGFTEYYNSMTCAAVPFEEAKQRSKLSHNYEIESLPTLIILNAADGSMVDADAQSAIVYAKGDGSKALKLWNKI